MHPNTGATYVCNNDMIGPANIVTNNNDARVSSSGNSPLERRTPTLRSRAMGIVTTANAYIHKHDLKPPPTITVLWDDLYHEEIEKQVDERSGGGGGDDDDDDSTSTDLSVISLGSETRSWTSVNMTRRTPTANQRTMDDSFHTGSGSVAADEAFFVVPTNEKRIYDTPSLRQPLPPIIPPEPIIKRNDRRISVCDPDAKSRTTTQSSKSNLLLLEQHLSSQLLIVALPATPLDQEVVQLLANKIYRKQSLQFLPQAVVATLSTFVPAYFRRKYYRFKNNRRSIDQRAKPGLEVELSEKSRLVDRVEAQHNTIPEMMKLTNC